MAGEMQRCEQCGGRAGMEQGQGSTICSYCQDAALAMAEHAYKTGGKVIDLAELACGKIEPLIYEYRTEAIPLLPGENGRTTQLLNAYAADGWRLVSSHVVNTKPGVAKSLEEQVVGIGLVVILERVKR